MKEATNSSAAKEVTQKKGLSRRKFLGYAGGVAGAALVLDACKKEDDPVIADSGAIDLGTRDEGVLNYLFVLQQIEAAFYIKLVGNGYSYMSGPERELFTEIRDQEIAHREFLRNYLQNNGTVVEVDLDPVTFSDRNSVLENGEFIENIVTGAMIEAGRLVVTPHNIELVAKMASVEARHATTMSNLRSTGNFFGPVDASGSEPGMLPSNVITTMNKFLKTKVSGNRLPNS